MAHSVAHSVRRRFVVWIVAVVACAATVSAEYLVAAPRARIAGVDLSGALVAAPYVALVVVIVASVRWLRALRTKGRRTITVRELRELAGR